MIWQVAKALHYLGLIMGVSGATVLAILFKKAIKEKALLPVVFTISRTTLNIVWAGLALQAVSGIILSKLDALSPLVGSVFWYKLIIVAALILLTAYIEFCVYRRANGVKAPEKRFALCRKNVWLCWLVMLLWYVVLVLSVYVVR